MIRVQYQLNRGKGTGQNLLRSQLCQESLLPSDFKHPPKKQRRTDEVDEVERDGHPVQESFLKELEGRWPPVMKSAVFLTLGGNGNGVF